MKIAGQNARADIRKQPAAHGAVRLWDRPIALLRDSGRTGIGKLVRKTGEYRFRKCKAFGRRNVRRALRWLHEQTVNVHVDSELGDGGHTGYFLLAGFFAFEIRMQPSNDAIRPSGSAPPQKPFESWMRFSISCHSLRLWLESAWGQRRESRARLHCFTPQLGFQRLELRVNVLLRLALSYDLFTITPQEIVNRFDSDPDRTGGFVLVEVLEAKIRCARLFNNAFDDAVNRGIVPALETRNFQSHQVGVPRRKLRGPYLVVGAAGIRILPGILDVQRAADHPRAHLPPEQPFEQVFIARKRVLRENRVSEFLELLKDFVVQS